MIPGNLTLNNRLTTLSIERTPRSDSRNLPRRDAGFVAGVTHGLSDVLMIRRGRRNRVFWALIVGFVLAAFIAGSVFLSADPYRISIEKTKHGENLLSFAVPFGAKVERPNRKMTSVTGEPTLLLAQTAMTAPQEPDWWLRAKRTFGIASPKFQWTVVLTCFESPAVRAESTSDETMGIMRVRRIIIQSREPTSGWVYQLTYTIRWRASEGRTDPIAPILNVLRESFTVRGPDR